MSLFGTGLQRICAVVAASKAAEMARLVRSALKQTRTVELRLDWLSSDTERAQFLGWLRKSHPRNATFLATCRRREGGGKLAGGVDRELYWLTQACEAGCQWCDLEVETLRKLPGQSVREYAVPRRVMLSMHDFERTPDLPRSVSPPAHGGVDAVKIAAEARTIRDSVRLLRLARNSKSFVAVPMGEAGLPARILALREGSALAYAPVASATAPGQVSLHDMKYLYRAHALTRRTRVYGVIGDPVGHSLSPLLHNTGFIARRIDAVYLPFLVHDLRDFLKAVPEFGLRGFSVTHPHKQAILKYLKECDPLAAEIGAVNTVVVRRNGSLYGGNTDYLGLLRALEKKLRIKGSRILVFGAGGAARAAVFALARSGATVAICARREKAARQLARAMVFLSTSQKAHNEAFNVTNGDLFRWKHLWPRIARLFDMPCGEVQTISLPQWAADKNPVWERIVRRHNLEPCRLDEVALWPFADFVFRQSCDVISSMTKIRMAGFHDSVDTEELYLPILQQYREARILP